MARRSQEVVSRLMGAREGSALRRVSYEACSVSLATYLARPGTPVTSPLAAPPPVTPPLAAPPPVTPPLAAPPPVTPPLAAVCPTKLVPYRWPPTWQGLVLRSFPGSPNAVANS
jgi:hypothetical protein